MAGLAGGEERVEQVVVAGAGDELREPAELEAATSRSSLVSSSNRVSTQRPGRDSRRKSWSRRTRVICRCATPGFFFCQKPEVEVMVTSRRFST